MEPSKWVQGDRALTGVGYRGVSLTQSSTILTLGNLELGDAALCVDQLPSYGLKTVAQKICNLLT